MNRLFLRKLNIRRYISVLLVASMLMASLAGCGKSAEQAPGLLEPITATESSRPVMRRDVGDLKIVKGYAVPEAYPVFSEKNITIKDIKVDFGDYVEEGDLIAVGDTSKYDESIESLSRDLEFLQEKREKSSNISDAVVADLTYEQDREIYVNDYNTVLDYSNKIYNQLENGRYTLAMIDSDISDITDRISELRRLRDKLIFTAPHSGYVTFVKDFSSTNAVGTSENIAVISDFNDLYIEATGLKIKDYKEKEISEHYTMSDGKKVPLELYEYTPGEVSYAEAVSEYPYVRYRTDKIKMQPGETIPLYIRKRTVNDVLVIGIDSMFTEGDSTYCYVIDSEGNKERREITTGMMDKHYVEVKSGLEEGEQVYYENKAVMPVNYTEYEVSINDYVEIFSSELVTLHQPKVDIYLAPCDGMLTNVSVHTGDLIDAEKELCTIETVVGKGDIADVNNLIIDNDKNHTDRINELNSSENELNAALQASQNAPAPIASDTDAVKASLYRSEEIESNLFMVREERELEEYRYAYDDTSLRDSLRKLSVGNDTDGIIVTTAENAGKAGKVNLKTNTTVMKGQYLCTICSAGEKRIIKVNMPIVENGLVSGCLPGARPGQKVTLTKDGKDYTGKVVGAGGSSEVRYLFTRDGKEHLTYSAEYTEGQIEPFFICLDDDSIVDETISGNVSFKGSEISSGTTVPARAVFSESFGINGEKRYFVWKITDSGLSKQYVTMYEISGSSNTLLVLDGIEVGDIVAVED